MDNLDSIRIKRIAEVILVVCRSNMPEAVKLNQVELILRNRLREMEC